MPDAFLTLAAYGAHDQPQFVLSRLVLGHRWASRPAQGKCISQNLARAHFMFTANNIK